VMNLTEDSSFTYNTERGGWYDKTNPQKPEDLQPPPPPPIAEPVQHLPPTSPLSTPPLLTTPPSTGRTRRYVDSFNPEQLFQPTTTAVQAAIAPPSSFSQNLSIFTPISPPTEDQTSVQPQ